MESGKKRILVIVVALLAGALIIAALVLYHQPPDYEDGSFAWQARAGEDGGNDILIRGANVDQVKNSLTGLICAVNRTDRDPESYRAPSGEPKLKFKGMEGDIIRVEVINDEYLTQQMGSTGAQEYLAAATFTLTEYAGVKAVLFIFEEGDHAAPGLYTRDGFLKSWTIINP